MKPSLRLPLRLEARILSISVLFAGAAACSGASGAGATAGDAQAPPGDSAGGKEAGGDGATTMSDARAEAAGDGPTDASPSDASADAGPRLCVPSVDDAGTIDLSYLDGGLVGTAVLYADGGGEVFLLDGGYGGTVVTDASTGMQYVEDAGPCDGFV